MDNSSGKVIRIARAERRGVLLHLLCLEVVQLESINNLMDRLAGRFMVKDPPENEMDLVDTMVAVNVGGRWMRATMGRNGVVDFFDVGKKKAVLLDDVRAAEPEMNMPRITFWCVLSNFFVHCGVSTIEEDLQGMECEMKSMTRVGKVQMVDLWKNGEPLSQSLERDRLGVLASPRDFVDHHQLETHQDSVLTAVRLQSALSPAAGASFSLTANLLTMTRMLPVGVRLSVGVASAANGPQLFFVQLRQHVQLVDLISRMQEQPLGVLPNIGDPCMVQMPNGQGLARSIVRRFKESSVEALLLDIDMSVIEVNLACLREMPALLKQIPPLVTPVSLYGAERFAESCSESFNKLVMGKAMEMTVLPGNHVGTQKCALYTNDNNILDLLTETVISKTYKQEKIEPDCKYMVQLTSVRPTSKGNWAFYVQLAPNTHDLTALNEKVNQYCKCCIPASHQFLTGDAVFARYETNGQWMRAVVIASHARCTEVLFVDSGVEAEVEELRAADPGLVQQLEAQAIQCYFVDLEIQKDIAGALKALVGQKLHFMKVIECLENYKYRVMLFDPSGYPPKDISTLLLQQRMARYNSMSSIASVSGRSSSLHHAFDLAPEQQLDSVFLPPTPTPTTPSATPTPPKFFPPTRTGSALSNFSEDKWSSAANLPPEQYINPFSTSQSAAAIASQPVQQQTPVPELIAALQSNAPQMPATSSQNFDTFDAAFGTPRRKSTESSSDVSSIAAKRHKIDPVITPPKMDSVSSYCYTELVVNPNSKFLATLSWMVNPSKFFLQPKCLASSLDELMGEIEAVDPDRMPFLHSVENGKHCLAKFEGAWYRAKVLSSLGDTVDVSYVDYGNMARIPLRQVRAISIRFTELQTQAIPCSLRGVGGKTNWTSKEADELTNLITDCTLKIEVVGVWNDTFSVIIKKDKLNINLKLGATQESLAPITKIPDMRPLETQEAMVSWFISPNDFYLQPKDYQVKLKNLQVQCNKCFKGCKKSEKNLKVGDLVLALTGVETFARAEVLAIKEDKAKLRLVDCGKILVASISSLNPLPDQLKAVEKHALRCTLFDVEPYPGPEWPKAGQCAAIDMLFQSTQLTYKVIKMNRDGVAQVVVRVQGEDVRDLMQLNGVALREVENYKENSEDLKSYYMSSLDLLPFVYVSEEDNLKNISWIRQQLGVENLKVMQEDIQPGQQCIVDLDKRGQSPSWHRAKMLPDRSLFLIDFGLTLPEEKTVYEMPKSMEKLPPQVIRACFPLLPPEGSTSFGAAAVQKLQSLICEGTPKKVSCREIGRQNGVLYLNPQGLLVKNSLKPELKDLMQLSVKSVLISHFERADCIFLQEDLAKVAWMEQQMEKPMDEFESVKVGQLCATQFEEFVYRCKILEDDRIFFIDYGNEDVAADKYWRLSPEVESVPPLAMQCSLKGAGDLSKEEEAALEELLAPDEEYEVVFVTKNEFVIFKSKQGLLDVAKRMAPAMKKGPDPEQKEEVVAADTDPVEAEEVVEDERAEPDADLSEIKDDVDKEAEAVASVGDPEDQNPPVEEESEAEPEAPLEEVVQDLSLEEQIPQPSTDDLKVEMEPGSPSEDQVTQPIPDDLENEIKAESPAEVQVIQPADLEPEMQPEDLVQDQITEEDQENADIVDSEVQIKDSSKPEDGFQRFYISAFVSPDDFHLVPDLEAVHRLSEELSHLPDYPEAELAKNEVCAALSDKSKLWGRAQILTLRPPTGNFFDTGCVDQISKFKQLADKHLDMDPMAIKCKLRKGQSEEGLKQDVWIEAKVEDGWVERPNSRRKAVVTHYESHCELYLRPVENDVTAMEIELGLGFVVSRVTEGQLYAAKLSLGCWRRVRVTATQSEGCSVFFVDHGFYGTAKQLKMLSPKWLERPEAAKLCFLKPVPSPEIRDRIKQLLSPGTVVEVEGLGHGDVAHEVAVYLGGNNVAKMEPELRPEAEAFVPSRNWMAIGCQVMTTFVTETPADDELWKESVASVGQFLLRAEKLGILSAKGLAAIREAFFTHRNGGPEYEDSPSSLSPDSIPPEEKFDLTEPGTNPAPSKSKFELRPAKLCIEQ